MGFRLRVGKSDQEYTLWWEKIHFRAKKTVYRVLHTVLFQRSDGTAGILQLYRYNIKTL